MSALGVLAAAFAVLLCWRLTGDCSAMRRFLAAGVWRRRRCVPPRHLSGGKAKRSAVHPSSCRGD